MRAWQNSRLCDKVVGRIQVLMAATLEHKSGNVHVLVTGELLLRLSMSCAAAPWHSQCDERPGTLPLAMTGFRQGRRQTRSRTCSAAAAGHSLGGALAALDMRQQDAATDVPVGM